MTFKDLDKKAFSPKEIPEEEATPANKSDGKKSHEKATSTGAKQALRPAEDDDLFDNMPV
ncbi:hypothetical protein O4H61_18790 [Roseovarius aestuarii]|nr:hypothetical protein [Roseovarius aestuarii]